jgi:hypothetical protein
LAASKASRAVPAAGARYRPREGCAGPRAAGSGLVGDVPAGGVDTMV